MKTDLPQCLPALTTLNIDLTQIQTHLPVCECLIKMVYLHFKHYCPIYLHFLQQRSLLLLTKSPKRQLSDVTPGTGSQAPIFSVSKTFSTIPTSRSVLPHLNEPLTSLLLPSHLYTCALSWASQYTEGKEKIPNCWSAACAGHCPTTKIESLVMICFM